MKPVIISLYSGSSGNCTYIRMGETEILIDAGKSLRQLVNSLASIGRSLNDIDAIFITHEHGDHVKSLEALSKKFNTPIHITIGSAQKVKNKFDELIHTNIVAHPVLYTVDLKDLTVCSFETPHDSVESVGFVISSRIDANINNIEASNVKMLSTTKKNTDTILNQLPLTGLLDLEEELNQTNKQIKIGYCTDIGYISDSIRKSLIGCEYVVIESNHDVEVLMVGPYPYQLKQRIRSKFGHLSNDDCAEFLCELVENGTNYIMLAHLSGENNTKDLAFASAYSGIGHHLTENGGRVNLKIADPDTPVRLV